MIELQIEAGNVGQELEIPLDLFDSLRITTGCYGDSPSGWRNVLEILGEMEWCQRALDQVKTLKVELCVHDDEYLETYPKNFDPSHPLERIRTIFGVVLESMTSLESLIWRIRPPHGHFFEKGFKARDLFLQWVATLKKDGRRHSLLVCIPLMSPRM